MSLNLHQIVRGAISSVNADEQVYLVRSTGNSNVKGRIVATYGAPELIGAQIQTLSNDDLRIVNETERTERDRKFYLFSDPDYTKSPASIIRYLGRTGDFIYRPFDQTYWKIYCVAEDFAPVGWVQVLASQQVQTPPSVVELITEALKRPEEPEPEPEPEPESPEEPLND